MTHSKISQKYTEVRMDGHSTQVVAKIKTMILAYHLHKAETVDRNLQRLLRAMR